MKTFQDAVFHIHEDNMLENEINSRFQYISLFPDRFKARSEPVPYYETASARTRCGRAIAACP